MSFTNPNMNQRMVGGQVCPGKYATLGGYNQCGSACSRGITAPVPTAGVSGYYIVPDVGGAPGYNTLQHGNSDACNRGSNYFNIYSAYGQNAGNCQQRYMGAICH